MHSVVILTDPETADGFRLAGARVLVAESPAAAQDVLVGLLDDEGTGIVAVNEAFMAAASERTRRRIESMYRPIVVPLPVRETVSMPSDRLARLARLIRRAVGFDITLRRQS